MEGQAEHERDLKFMANEFTKKPFTFRDGTTVLVRPLTMEDYKVLDEWVRSEYMKNVSAALKVLGAVERQTFLMTALDRVASLTFQYGLGSEILNGNAFGLCRLAYQLIENPPFSFEGFFEKVFPEHRFSDEGLQMVVDLSNMVYENGVEVGRDENGMPKTAPSPISQDIARQMDELNGSVEATGKEETLVVGETEEMID